MVALMRASLSYFACWVSTCCFLTAAAQTTAKNTAADDALLDRMIATNVLTTPGAAPFHAILEITSEASSSTEHHGRIEVFWEEPSSYSLTVETPEFGQTLIVSGDKVQETDRGDFYPGWVRDFVAALLDPMARAKDLRGHPNAYGDVPAAAFYCIKRDDRHNGITDDLTFAQVCYNKSLGQSLANILDFTHYLSLENFSPFHGKLIARTYHVSTLDDTNLQGVLTTLEDWNPDKTQLTITSPTAPSGRILTSFVSMATGESLLQSSPQDVRWPPVREGRLDGYLIAHVITDLTGQVREASPYHTDDNRELTSFVKQVALQYKFKPFLVDGVPYQLETPLLIHFTTTQGEPIPDLDDAQTRKLVSGCELPHRISDPASAGQQIEIIFSVSPDGHLGTLGSSDRKIPVLTLFQKFRGCTFGIYSQNGKATQYRAHLSVTAQ